MYSKPQIRRAAVFVDGQNLFHGAREAFGVTYPNYGVTLLAEHVCKLRGWVLADINFYTGLPDPNRDSFWSRFWEAKLAHMGRKHVRVNTRQLRYRERRVRCPNGNEIQVPYKEEKGIDVRIALDIINGAVSCDYDVAVVFSQDQDLAEAANEIRRIAKDQQRWICVASAFPDGPGTLNHRGINDTDWIRIRKEEYERCLDPRDYGFRESKSLVAGWESERDQEVPF